MPQTLAEIFDEAIAHPSSFLASSIGPCTIDEVRTILLHFLAAPTSIEASFLSFVSLIASHSSEEVVDTFSSALLVLLGDASYASKNQATERTLKAALSFFQIAPVPEEIDDDVIEVLSEFINDGNELISSSSFLICLKFGLIDVIKDAMEHEHFSHDFFNLNMKFLIEFFETKIENYKKLLIPFMTMAHSSDFNLRSSFFNSFCSSEIILKFFVENFSPKVLERLLYFMAFSLKCNFSDSSVVISFLTNLLSKISQEDLLQSFHLFFSFKFIIFFPIFLHFNLISKEQLFSLLTTENINQICASLLLFNVNNLDLIEFSEIFNQIFEISTQSDVLLSCLFYFSLKFSTYLDSYGKSKVVEIIFNSFSNNLISLNHSCSEALSLIMIDLDFENYPSIFDNLHLIISLFKNLSINFDENSDKIKFLVHKTLNILNDVQISDENLSSVLSLLLYCLPFYQIDFIQSKMIELSNCSYDEVSSHLYFILLRDVLKKFSLLNFTLIHQKSLNLSLISSNFCFQSVLIAHNNLNQSNLIDLLNFGLEGLFTDTSDIHSLISNLNFYLKISEKEVSFSFNSNLFCTCLLLSPNILFEFLKHFKVLELKDSFDSILNLLVFVFEKYSTQPCAGSVLSFSLSFCAGLLTFDRSFFEPVTNFLNFILPLYQSIVLKSTKLLEIYSNLEDDLRAEGILSRNLSWSITKFLNKILDEGHEVPHNMFELFDRFV
ncbi:hypothetical protein RCL1_006927 [Eukaryota sp. TZLM3-RCL]